MIVIDSDLLIDVLNADADAIALLEALEVAGEELATTSLNVAEVLRGTPERGRQRIAAEQLLTGFVEVPFGPRAARRFANLMTAMSRMGRPPPSIDAMIAAATLEAGARLATRNQRDFERMPGLEMVDV